MISLRKGLLTGSAAAVFIACAGLALAQSSALHYMSVALPDGGTAQIAYSGDIPPKVSFESDPFRAASYGPSSIAALDRISAAMDQEMNAVMNEAGFWDMPMPTPVQMLHADLRNAKRGSFCMESMSITRTNPNAAPKVVSHQYGNCAPIGQAAFGFAPDNQEKSAHTITVQTPRESGPLSRSPLIEAAYQPR